jgi:chaperonin cofactor prefoldin
MMTEAEQTELEALRLRVQQLERDLHDLQTRVKNLRRHACGVAEAANKLLEQPGMQGIER